MKFVQSYQCQRGSALGMEFTQLDGKRVRLMMHAFDFVEDNILAVVILTFLV
jgi:hypothetical protein